MGMFKRTTAAHPAVAFSQVSPSLPRATLDNKLTHWALPKLQIFEQKIQQLKFYHLPCERLIIQR